MGKINTQLMGARRVLMYSLAPKQDSANYEKIELYPEQRIEYFDSESDNCPKKRSGRSIESLHNGYIRVNL